MNKKYINNSIYLIIHNFVDDFIKNNKKNRSSILNNHCLLSNNYIKVEELLLIKLV